MLRRAREMCTWVLVGALLLTTSGLASAGNGPKTGPAGEKIITAEQEAAEHAALVKQLEAEMRAQHPIDRRKNDPGITPMYQNGDIYITGPNWETGTGYVNDSDISNTVLSRIWTATLWILGYAWETVGTLINDIVTIYDIVGVDQTSYSDNESYHSYHYWTRDGEYYDDGSWYYGARVENQETWKNAWTSFYDTDHVQWNKWQYGDSPAYAWSTYGCHYYDDTWISGMTYDTYLGIAPYIFETYDDCTIWEP